MKEDTDKTWMEVHGGYAKDMTLRDEFAGQAMQGLIVDVEAPRCKYIAQTAYEMADAMLAVKQSREAK
jgi:predicted secreted Zn-dependent protease